MNPERFSRQTDIVPDLLHSRSITIVGVGAVGRQLALQLAALGGMTVTLYDFDEVEESNIATQLYREEHMGLKKVDATGKDMIKINSEMTVVMDETRWDPSIEIEGDLFMCPDSIETRTALFNSARESELVDFFADCRIAGEVIRVMACNMTDDGDVEYYEKTLFSEDERFEARCTSKGTIYTAACGASMMLAQYTRYLRGFPLDKDVLLNLTAMDIVLNVEGDDDEEAEPEGD